MKRGTLLAVIFIVVLVVIFAPGIIRVVVRPNESLIKEKVCVSLRCEEKDLSYVGGGVQRETHVLFSLKKNSVDTLGLLRDKKCVRFVENSQVHSMVQSLLDEIGGDSNLTIIGDVLGFRESDSLASMFLVNGVESDYVLYIGGCVLW